jgi:hypothetical protein
MGKPWLSSLTLIGFMVNAAIDQGKGAQVSFNDIYQGLEKGTLFQDLSEKVPGAFDFSLFPQGSEKEKELLEVIGQVAGGLEGRERRKTGVEKSGLNLLIAFIFQVIQQEEWSKPS